MRVPSRTNRSKDINSGAYFTFYERGSEVRNQMSEGLPFRFPISDFRFLLVCLGDFSGRDPPVPIPNTVVKPVSAEGTA